MDSGHQASEISLYGYECEDLMDIIPYQEEHRIFRDTFCRFLEREIVPHIDQWEEDGIIPRWAWKKLGDNGFLCTAVLAEYGGQ